MPDESTNPGVKDSFGTGLFYGTLANLASIASLIIPPVGAFILLGIGITQLLWLLPMYFSYRSRGATETAKGIVVIAGVTFMLNAACWGVMLGGMGNLH